MSYVFATDNQAPGAWPNGSTVRKLNSQPTDGTPDGTAGRVYGSIDARAAMPKAPARFCYFVVWANRPGVPVFVADTNNDGTPRLELVPATQSE